MLVEAHYEKGDEVRYLAHLELMRAVERAVRRAKLPMEYSQGFNPRPRIRYSDALGVGVTSEDERVCLHLASYLPAEEIGRRLARTLPRGLRLHGVRELPGGTKPRYELLDRSEYVVDPAEDWPEAAELERRITALLGRDEVVVHREKEERTKQVDIRPYISQLAIDEDRLWMVLGSDQEGRARPDEVLAELGLADDKRPVPRIHRKRRFQQRKGTRRLGHRR